MKKLTELEVQGRLSKLSGWQLKDKKWMEKKYRFREFLVGISFVQAIADLSEEVNHHPFISIDYKVVILKLSSWQANGLTGLDMDLAERYDRLYKEVVSVKPTIPAHLRQYVVDQRYEKYTPIDQAVWRYVMRRNHRFLKETAHPSYVNGLQDSGINIESIPKIEEMNECLKPFGWAAVTIPGYIPGVVFFDFQGRGILPIATDIRTLEHVNYTPAPDIIHEAAGHAPILCDPQYAEYVKIFGNIGSKAIATKEEHDVFEAIRTLSSLLESGDASEAEIQKAKTNLQEKQKSVKGLSEADQISRLYWWTVEYGLIGDLKNPRIYGAGLLSSVGESVLSLTEKVKKIPFDLETVIQTGFDITTMQPQLFVSESFDQLIEAVQQFSKRMAFCVGGTESLFKALHSGNTVHFTYSTGLQVTGTVSRIICDAGGEAAYVKTMRPTALSINGKELIGHGKGAHPEGFGSPIGSLKGKKRDLEYYTEEDLKELNIVKAQKCELVFESGLLVKGEVEQVIKRNGKIIMIEFNEAEVTFQDELLFDPTWGTYHMATGTAITSVSAGAADPESFFYSQVDRPQQLPPRK
jgi:phenylalanine-4-hydroxylase